MKIIEMKIDHAPIALDLIKRSFQPLLEKYNDHEQNPATKSLECLIAEMNHPTSDTYLFKKEDNYIGYVRVNKREENEYSINDFCIDPDHQGKGYAQFFLKEIEEKFQDVNVWSLVTILEETKLCHLYEKMGYIRKNVIKEVNLHMHFVLYKKC